MEWDPSRRVSESPALLTSRDGELSLQQRRSRIGTETKARQSAKIRELGDAVRAAGFLTLDEQAKVLGLARSTAWTISQANHKTSGLSAAIINRMLAAPQLPPLARSKILEYVQEKAAGLYGGSRSQLRRFTARLTINGIAWPANDEET